jgi:apolipoprotein N-acyltransferase
VGTLLGVDNQDPGVARALAARGATLLASSTHDWEQLSTYQRAMARVNAVATGRPLARADWRYGSSIVSPEGRELAVAEGGKRRTTLVAAVPPARETPYGSIGDALGLAALAVFALASMLAAAARVRRPVSASAP